MKCCATLMSRVRVPCSLLGPTGRSAPSGRQGTQIAPKWRNNTAVSGSGNERHTLAGHRQLAHLSPFPVSNLGRQTSEDSAIQRHFPPTLASIGDKAYHGPARLQNPRRSSRPLPGGQPRGTDRRPPALLPSERARRWVQVTFQSVPVTQGFGAWL